MRWLAIAALALLSACGPNVGSLQRGEQGTVTRVDSGDALALDNGLRVYLAEIEAPRRDQPYAREAEQELESLALHRKALLAYGGTRRYTRRARAANATGVTTTSSSTSADAASDGEPDAPPSEIATAHVYVQSEGGRWIWLEHELVARGAAFVRPRHDNHARTAELLAVEAQARASRRGLWALHDYRVLTPNAAADAAAAAQTSCYRGRLALVEGRIARVDMGERRASLDMESSAAPFSIVVFGQAFSSWDGPTLSSYSGKRVRVRGPIGMFHDAAQICVDDAREIEVLTLSH